MNEKEKAKASLPMSERPPYPFRENVSSKYGAPVGRLDTRFDDLEEVFLAKVPINSGGYDPGGAYWGLSIPLWCAFTKSGGVIYTRAETADKAKAFLENEHPLFACGCYFSKSNSDQMSFRKVTVSITVKMQLKIDEGVEVSEVLNELDYRFSDTTGNASVESTEVTDHKVIDSK